MNALSKSLSAVRHVAILVVIVPYAVVALLCTLIYGVALTMIAWLLWRIKGVDTLVVYSESPKWHEYMVESVIPNLQPRALVLNWSERRHWRSMQLSVAIFRFFGGDREFNPLVIVLRPFRVPQTFRFWQAFIDRKHGNLEPLREIESKLYTYLDMTPTNA